MTTDGSGYFLYHSIGQYPGKAEEMATAYADFAAHWGAWDDAQWGHALGIKARFIEQWSRLIGAEVGTVTTCESVTAGLYAILGALPPARIGKRVLIAADCFPSLHFLLQGLSQRMGFSLETVPLRPGESWVRDEDMIAAWGPDVGVAVLTWVTSTASHRGDLARLVAHGRAQGSLIGVDITQAAGLLPFDVSAPEIDFAISTSLKWVCGAPGAGMLYVAPPLVHECAPEFRGWFSQANPFSWDLDAFEFAPDIRRFDSGTPGVVACAGTLPALDWVHAQDRAAMQLHNRTLVQQVMDGADTLGLDVVSPRESSARGGSVMLRLPEAVAPGAMLETLRAKGLFADTRSQILRISPGVMASSAGVNRLLETLGRVLHTRQRGTPR